jgi:hypothetical protein
MSFTDPSNPVVGQPVLIAFFDGNHVVHQSVAHVLSLGPVDAFTNKPTISVAYPTPGVLPSVLSSASWFKGYSRSVGVQHVSHPHVQDSKVSIAYGDVDDFPSPGEKVANRIFGRNIDVAPTDVSLGQRLINDGEFDGSGSEKYPSAVDWTKTRGAGVTDDTSSLESGTEYRHSSGLGSSKITGLTPVGLPTQEQTDAVVAQAEAEREARRIPTDSTTGAAAVPVIETNHYTDGSSATGVAPLPDLSPAQQDAEKVVAAQDSQLRAPVPVRTA